MTKYLFGEDADLYRRTLRLLFSLACEKIFPDRRYDDELDSGLLTQRPQHSRRVLHRKCLLVLDPGHRGRAPQRARDDQGGDAATGEATDATALPMLVA